MENLLISPKIVFPLGRELRKKREQEIWSCKTNKNLPQGMEIWIHIEFGMFHSVNHSSALGWIHIFHCELFLKFGKTLSVLIFAFLIFGQYNYAKGKWVVGKVFLLGFHLSFLLFLLRRLFPSIFLSNPSFHWPMGTMSQRGKAHRY